MKIISSRNIIEYINTIADFHMTESNTTMQCTVMLNIANEVGDNDYMMP